MSSIQLFLKSCKRICKLKTLRTVNHETVTNKVTTQLCSFSCTFFAKIQRLTPIFGCLVHFGLAKTFKNKTIIYNLLIKFIQNQYNCQSKALNNQKTKQKQMAKKYKIQNTKYKNTKVLITKLEKNKQNLKKTINIYMNLIIKPYTKHKIYFTF